MLRMRGIQDAAIHLKIVVVKKMRRLKETATKSKDKMEGGPSFKIVVFY